MNTTRSLMEEIRSRRQTTDPINTKTPTFLIQSSSYSRNAFIERYGAAKALDQIEEELRLQGSTYQSVFIDAKRYIALILDHVCCSSPIL